MIHEVLSGTFFMMNIFDQISKFKANAWKTFLNKIYMYPRPEPKLVSL